MLIHRILPDSQWGKVDRGVMTNRNLTDGAKVLYALLIGLPAGTNYTDSYISALLGVGVRAIERRRRELKAEDLIFLEKMAPKVYQAYVGHSKMPASKVRNIIKNKHDMMGE